MDSAAPGNGLKVMAVVLAAFFLAAIYGQWQRVERAHAVQFKITATPNDSPAPSPNEH